MQWCIRFFIGKNERMHDKLTVKGTTVNAKSDENRNKKPSHCHRKNGFCQVSLKKRLFVISYGLDMLLNFVLDVSHS